MLQPAEVAEDLGFDLFSARFVSCTDLTDGRAKIAAEKGGSVYEYVPFLHQQTIKSVQLYCLAAPPGKVVFL